MSSPPPNDGCLFFLPDPRASGTQPEHSTTPSVAPHSTRSPRSSGKSGHSGGGKGEGGHQKGPSRQQHKEIKQGEARGLIQMLRGKGVPSMTITTGSGWVKWLPEKLAEFTMWSNLCRGRRKRRRRGRRRSTDRVTLSSTRLPLPRLAHIPPVLRTDHEVKFFREPAFI